MGVERRGKSTGKARGKWKTWNRVKGKGTSVWSRGIAKVSG